MIHADVVLLGQGVQQLPGCGNGSAQRPVIAGGAQLFLDLRSHYDDAGQTVLILDDLLDLSRSKVGAGLRLGQGDHGIAAQEAGVQNLNGQSVFLAGVIVSGNVQSVGQIHVHVLTGGFLEALGGMISVELILVDTLDGISTVSGQIPLIVGHVAVGLDVLNHLMGVVLDFHIAGLDGHAANDNILDLLDTGSHSGRVLLAHAAQLIVGVQLNDDLVAIHISLGGHTGVGTDLAGLVALSDAIVVDLEHIGAHLSAGQVLIVGNYDLGSLGTVGIHKADGFHLNDGRNSRSGSRLGLLAGDLDLLIHVDQIGVLDGGIGVHDILHGHTVCSGQSPQGIALLDCVSSCRAGGNQQSSNQQQRNQHFTFLEHLLVNSFFFSP